MIPDNEDANRLLEVAKSVVMNMEGKVDLSYGTGFTDAEILWSYAGIPSIIMGPGGRAHVQDEYLDLPALKKVVRAYVEIAKGLFMG